MKYISLDISTINGLDQIQDLVTVAMMFCDTDNDQTEYIEFNVRHDQYLVKDSAIEKAAQTFNNILKSEQISCYFENLVAYTHLHLEDRGISDEDQITVVTNNLLERFGILKDLFVNQKIELFNVPGNNIESGLSHLKVCSVQREYFEKVYDFSK